MPGQHTRQTDKPLEASRYPVSGGMTMPRLHAHEHLHSDMPLEASRYPVSGGMTMPRPHAYEH